MKTLTARTLRVTNLFALAAAFTALCPISLPAETSGPGGPNLPPLVTRNAADGNSLWANSSAPQLDGSIIYTTSQFNWANGTSKISAWTIVTPLGLVLFADGTIGLL